MERGVLLWTFKLSGVPKGRKGLPWREASRSVTPPPTSSASWSSDTYSRTAVTGVEGEAESCSAPGVPAVLTAHVM